MLNAKANPEEKFREGLKDVVAVLTRLGQLTQSVEEVKDMAEAALVNDGQLRLLMAHVLKPEG